jgi:hypothetical protein
MQIDDPTLIDYKVDTFGNYMSKVETLDGDLILAYSFNENLVPKNKILVLETDPYGENDDDYLFFEGDQYIWEIDTFTMQGVKRNFQELFGPANPHDLVVAAFYYIRNDAFIMPEYRDEVFSIFTSGKDGP